MKPLIVGSNSQTGRSLLALLQARGVGFEVLPTESLVTGDIDALSRDLRDSKPSFVVNVDHFDGFEAPGLGQRDLEQRHVLLPQQAARLAESLNVAILQLSDYQVFSGSHDKPYTEDDEPHAQSLYGVTRWQGELSVQRFSNQFVILRVGHIFCAQGNNILTRLLAQWQESDEHVLATLPQFSPTPADDIARVIFAVLQQLECEAKVWGIYHYCSADTTTPFDFAEVVLASIAQFSDRMSKIKVVAREEEGARRKSRKAAAQGDVINQVLSCYKILNTFGICQRPWRIELATMLEKMEKTHE